MFGSPRRAKSALAGSLLAEKHLENEKMSDDLQAKINALHKKQLRLRADRDFQIKQAKEEAQVVFDQARIVKAKYSSNDNASLPTGWRVIEAPKNQNMNDKRIIKEAPKPAVFDPDDPRTYASLNDDPSLRPKVGRRRPKTPRRPRPKTAIVSRVQEELASKTRIESDIMCSEPAQYLEPEIDVAINATAIANNPTEGILTAMREEPFRCADFLGFIRPKTAEANYRPRGGFGDPNADFHRQDKGKNTSYPLQQQKTANQIRQESGDLQRPRTARSRRSVSRAQSRCDESGQSYKDLKSQSHIDFTTLALSNNKKINTERKRHEVQETEMARLQDRMKAFYENLDDFKIKAARMKESQLF